MSLAPALAKRVDPPGHGPMALPGVNDGTVGKDAITIPCEHVLLARVKLPSVPRRDRQAALRSAVEDLLAEPLDQVHIAAGPELGQDERLVAVLRHSVMAEWALLADAGHARLVPDVLALPVPPMGSLHASEAGGRVLVRLPDGTGLATRTEVFPTFWRAAGMPGIVLFGGQLPPELQIVAVQAMPEDPPPEALTFDLMIDRYARKGRRRVKGVAAVALLALIGHLAILGAETIALERIAQRQAALGRGEAADSPTDPQTIRREAGQQRQANTAREGLATGGVLPLLTQVSEALPAFDDGMVVRTMTFDARTGELGMLVEGQDLAALHDLESRLGAAGLNISSGAATSSNGTAEMRLVIRGPIHGQ